MTITIGELAITILFGTAGYILAALMVGLYAGERGRRRAAERMVTFGSPDEGSQGRPVSRAPAGTAEDRFARAGDEFSEETVQRGVEVLRQHAEEQGLTVTDEQLEQEARLMLAGVDVQPQ